MEENYCDLGVEGEGRKGRGKSQRVQGEQVLKRERGRRLWERKHLHQLWK